MKKEFIMTYRDTPLQALLASAGCEKGIIDYPADSENLQHYLDHDFYFERRYKLENNTSCRHPIPYGVFYRMNSENVPEYFVYQRTKVTGESRLAGKHSIGIGGHIEASNVFEHDDVEGLNKIMEFELSREFDEEFGYIFNMDDPSCANELVFVPRYLINSDFEQDRFHLGLVPFTRLPDSITGVTSKEDDQIAVGFFTYEQIRERYYDNLESWSQLIMDKMAQDAVQ